jgi:hypothetical protein
MKQTDLTRDRKVRVTLAAMLLLFLGLAACLVVAAFAKDSVALLAGLYVPFATGVGMALGLFINGNVKVHQAQVAAGEAPAPGSAP